MIRQTYRDSRGRFRRKTYRDSANQLATALAIVATVYGAILGYGLV